MSNYELLRNIKLSEKQILHSLIVNNEAQLILKTAIPVWNLIRCNALSLIFSHSNFHDSFKLLRQYINKKELRVLRIKVNLFEEALDELVTRNLKKLSVSKLCK